MTPATGTRLDRHEILHPLGQGGDWRMAKVWLLRELQQNKAR